MTKPCVRPVATYCPGRMADHSNFKSRGGFYQPELSPCRGRGRHRPSIKRHGEKWEESEREGPTSPTIHPMIFPWPTLRLPPYIRNMFTVRKSVPEGFPLSGLVVIDFSIQKRVKDPLQHLETQVSLRLLFSATF